MSTMKSVAAALNIDDCVEAIVDAQLSNPSKGAIVLRKVLEEAVIQEVQGITLVYTETGDETYTIDIQGCKTTVAYTKDVVSIQQVFDSGVSNHGLLPSAAAASLALVAFWS